MEQKVMELFGPSGKLDAIFRAPTIDTNRRASPEQYNNSNQNKMASISIVLQILSM